MQLVNPNATDSPATIAEQGGLLIPCVTRPEGSSTTWMSVITDNKLFNVSLNRTDAAQDAKAAAMELSTDPTQVGVDVDIVLDSVLVDGEEIGLIKGYDGSVTDPQSDNPRNIYVVKEMNRSGDLVLSNGNSTGRNASGLGFGAHGETLINNIVKDLSQPDFRRRMTMYLVFIHALYRGSITLDYENFSFEPNGDGLLAEKVGVIEYHLDKKLRRQQQGASSEAEGESAEGESAEGENQSESAEGEESAQERKPAGQAEGDDPIDL